MSSDTQTVGTSPTVRAILLPPTALVVDLKEFFKSHEWLLVLALSVLFGILAVSSETLLVMTSRMV